MTISDRAKLIHRRQYFYGPAFDGFPHWNTLSMPDGYRLAVHPELELTQTALNGYSLTLLGYLLDPDHPGDGNRAILERIGSQAQDVQALLATLDHFGGRYVLFVFHEQDKFVLNDAGGLRPVFFHRSADGALWLAPQPGLISKKFGFTHSAEAGQFLASDEILKNPEPWFPGTSTPFAEITHLLPNHLLHLDSGKVERFWPLKPLKKISLRQGVERSAAILRNMMKAAHQRFELALGLTGGFDSRVIFTASKELLSDIHIFTINYNDLSIKSSDIAVAGELTERAGVAHQVFACDKPMDDEFASLYEQNLEGSYRSYGKIVYGRFKNLDQKKVVIKAAMSEIARCFYYHTGVYPFNISPDFLCRVSRLGTDKLVQKSFSDWYADARHVEKLGYKVLDLFYWENRVASWQAMGQLEFDLAHEEFTPYNQRDLLVTMLGVNHNQRCMPKHRFHHELVKALWPEMDEVVYNPASKVFHKPFYEGPWMQAGRWIKYRILRKT
jgi:hypothetical protein